MFSATLSSGSRFSSWKTKPTRCRRSTACRRAESRDSSFPHSRTVPDVGRSSPAAHCSSVDLPDPETPSTAVNEPAAKDRDTPCSAVSAPRPRP
jgi:hypothetical protein